MSQPLTGSPFPVELAPGVLLTAPGVVGTAELRPGEQWGGEYRGPEESTEEFLEALAEVDFRQRLGVLIDTAHVDAGSAGTRTTDGEPAMVLTVPAVGDDEAQIAMCVDEFGIVTWHLPDGQSDGIGASRAEGTVTFTVERGGASGAFAQASEDRGLVTAMGKKLISVLVLPLLERGVGLVAAEVARHYENRRRPQGLLRLTPQGWTGPDDAFANWATDVDSPVLLLVHGTASSTAGFRSLAGGTLPGGAVLDDTLARLRSSYQGQVFAFDHHTLSSDLDANVDMFRRLWPPGSSRRPVDIVTHSRGGLVARALAASMAEPGEPLSPRRIIYVATPNGGTKLADPATTRAWIDRMTTMLNLIPDGPWSVATETLAGVLTVVRVVASGTVGGLPGLATMDPEGEVIKRLAVPRAGVEQYAVSVEFEPQGRLLHWLRAADLVVDKVFGDAPNDVVVPTGGVADVLARKLLVPPENRHVLGSRSDVWHCSMFTDETVHEALTGWLVP